MLSTTREPVSREALLTILVTMPFQDIRRPSLQLGLLKAIGCAHGFRVETLHANIDFAVLIGPELYSMLCEHRGRQVGDWLFSRAAFNNSAPDLDGRFLTDFHADLHYLGDSGRRQLREIRDEVVPAYLDALVEEVDWSRVRIVGFSSTFQQNTASLALARRLKERFPELITIFGGANFDGEMGLEFLRTVNDIDFVAVGEGDAAFPALLGAVADGTDTSQIAGVATRTENGISYVEATPTKMDDLPVPDYTEYFDRRNRHGLGGGPSAGVVIPFESARGCWWGEKHHCTFCGLNATTMTWRSKSPERLRVELAEQAARHSTFFFEAVDNILGPSLLTSLLPGFIDDGVDYCIFYEVKANLTRKQVQTLAQSGVKQIQPGIESLSSSVLALMEKGVRASQNVNLLRWARYYGIDVSWNLLWGFPGETASAYEKQAASMPHLLHLQPPINAGRVWMERFSPIFMNEKQFPTRYRRPEASYGYVYPSSIDLDEVAYFFEYQFHETLDHSVYEPVLAAVREWRTAWSGPTRPDLRFRASPEILQIYDTRRPGKEGTYTYRGDLARIYRSIADKPRTVPAVCAELDLRHPPEMVADLIGEWQSEGLVFVDEDRALALALPATEQR